MKPMNTRLCICNRINRFDSICVRSTETEDFENPTTNTKDQTKNNDVQSGAKRLGDKFRCP